MVFTAILCRTGFAKFATALALAKYMSAYSFTIKSWKSALMLAFLILLPMTLIILQRETGSALVYMAFFLMLYREGMPGVVLFSGCRLTGPKISQDREPLVSGAIKMVTTNKRMSPIYIM